MGMVKIVNSARYILSKQQDSIKIHAKLHNTRVK